MLGARRAHGGADPSLARRAVPAGTGFPLGLWRRRRRFPDRGAYRREVSGDRGRSGFVRRSQRTAHGRRARRRAAVRLVRRAGLDPRRLPPLTEPALACRLPDAAHSALMMAIQRVAGHP